MIRLVYLVLAVLPGMSAAAGAAAQPPGNERERVEQLVRSRLAELRGQAGQLIPVEDPAISAAFPGRVFVAVRFRRYPIAIAPPAPLKSQNLFVAADGKLQHLASVPELAGFLRAAPAPAKDAEEMKTAARAGLLLAEALGQDGFYKFEIPPGSLVVTPEGDGRKVAGKALVTAGGKGEITLSLTFDSAGSVKNVALDSRLMPGVRPICQATKLLDRDPVVRRMAEQDLLVMGRAAGPYLAERRAKAGPRLRRAIDRIWSRILAEGW
jgi:hypothetical protein